LGYTRKVLRNLQMKQFHKSDVPIGKVVKPGFYKVIVYYPNSRWKVKIEVKKSYENILYVKKLNPISEKSFNSLVNNIKNEPLIQLLDLFISELDKEG